MVYINRPGICFNNYHTTISKMTKIHFRDAEILRNARSNLRPPPPPVVATW